MKKTDEEYKAKFDEAQALARELAEYAEDEGYKPGVFQTAIYILTESAIVSDENKDGSHSRVLEHLLAMAKKKGA